MAAAGTRFDRFHSAHPMCSPTRAKGRLYRFDEGERRDVDITGDEPEALERLTAWERQWRESVKEDQAACSTKPRWDLGPFSKRDEPLLRDDGILLMVQGEHPTLGAWTLRQALIDPGDRTTVLEYQEEPFLYPEHEWEKEGMTGRTTVSNGLVHFKGRWLLYYGAADRVIGLAVCGP